MSKIYKFFSFLLVACLATVGAWAQTPVKSLADLENGAAYSIKSEGRGYLIFDAGKDASRAWCSDNTTHGATVTFDQTNLNHLWTFYTSASGGRYLFNLGAQKFLYKDSEGVGTTFSLEPLGNDVTFKASTSPSKWSHYGDIENYPVVIAFGNNEINLSIDQNPSVFTNWNDTGDTGNIMQIVKVADVSAELMADIRTAVNTYEGVTEPSADLVPTSVTPANEATVESLESVVVTFPKAVTYDDTKVITINSRTGYSETASVTVSTEDPTQVTIAAPAAITERGMYAASIPEGAFTAIADGSYNPAATFLYYVQPAENSYAYTAATPENASTLNKGLESVTLSFAEADGPGFADNTPINVLNEEGNPVATATLALSTENLTDVVLTLSERITANGTYTINVPEGYIYNSLYDGEADDKGVSMGAIYNSAFTLNYTVDYKGTLTPTVEPTTATGTLETITLNFEKEVTYDNTKTITLGNRMMGITKDITVAVSAEDAKVVTITLAEPVTEPGYLSLYIPEETFTATEDGTFNPELTSPITVLAPTNSFAFESTTPADNANLLELSTVKVTYTNAPTLATEGASVNVINTETSTAVTTATVAYDAEDRNSVVFTLAEAITTPGTYTLTIPDEFIWNSQYNDIAEDKGVSQGATYTPATTLTFNVIEPYPVNFDKNMNSSRADRTLRSITLTEEGQAGQTVTVANTSKIYNDQHETTTLTCNAGSTLTATFNYSGTWMHGYVYIDTENDGAFSFNEGNTDQSGTDLKAFAFYSGSFTNDASGYNSAGQSITGDNRANINPPSFTAPTTPGTYRIRFKVDWNSVDPGGQKAADGTVTSRNGIAANGGYIVDATLEVTGSTTPEGPIAPVSITPEDQSEVESFTSATITFEEDVTYNELIEVTIAQRNGLYYQKATVSVDGATVTVSAPEEITEVGTYAISVPAGAFSTTDGRTNEAFTTMFTITEPAGPADTFVYTSIEPVDGSEVAELSSITVTYPQWVCDYINETPFNVVDAESNVVTTASLTYNDNREDVVIVLEEPITAEGTYTITVPAGYIYSNEGYDPSAADKGVSNGAIYNPEFTLTYTVKAASEPINTFDYKSVDPANESVVKELGDITITFPANVANEVTDTPINVINSEDGSTVTTATLGFPLSEGYDKVVLRLTAAVKENGTYTITVPEGYIYDYDEAICNPEFTLTYTVDTVNGISTVTIDSLEGKTIYTIDGRKVSGKLQRGAYIIDGQKKFVK